MFKYIFILLLFIFTPIYAEEEKEISEKDALEKLPAGKTLLAIKKVWLQKNARELQRFFSDKIYLSLDKKRKGMYSREQATGIFKTYFQNIEIQEFSYYTKKTKDHRGMILYRYKEITSGKKKQKIIYICLDKYIKDELEIWCIYRINIIG